MKTVFLTSGLFNRFPNAFKILCNPDLIRAELFINFDGNVICVHVQEGQLVIHLSSQVD